MRKTAGYTWTCYKINTEIAKQLNISPILDKIQEYKTNWLQHIKRTPRNRLPRMLKKTTVQRAEETRGDHQVFWTCETGTSHQVAQLDVS